MTTKSLLRFASLLGFSLSLRDNKPVLRGEGSPCPVLLEVLKQNKQALARELQGRGGGLVVGEEALSRLGREVRDAPETRLALQVLGGEVVAWGSAVASDK